MFTESTNDCDHGRFSYFSEKTFIGWITQPTIIVGTPFTISQLKSLGFESFGEMFDESYDEIIPNNLRLQKTYKEIERVCKLPDNELSGYTMICYQRLNTIKKNYLNTSL